jgi:malonyl-CoA O-methyltransferase
MRAKPQRQSRRFWKSPFERGRSSQHFLIVSLDPNLTLEGERIRRSFDRAAAGYDQAAALQRRVADRLMRVVDGAPPRILDAGCGTGYGTAALMARFPQATLFAFDLAPGMLAATRARVPQAPSTCADVQALPFADACMDMVWSSLMLQWCNRTDLAFADVHRCLASGGRFVFSTFGPETLRELRESFADGRTHVSRFSAAEELRTQLAAAGFADIRIEIAEEQLYYPDVRSLMLELKAIGAHNATAGRARGLTGRHGWQAMLANYERHRSDKGLMATYELFYVSVRRA